VNTNSVYRPLDRSLQNETRKTLRMMDSRLAAVHSTPLRLDHSYTAAYEVILKGRRRL